MTSQNQEEVLIRPATLADVDGLFALQVGLVHHELPIDWIIDPDAANLTGSKVQ
jgi:hypothetical protein